MNKGRESADGPSVVIVAEHASAAFGGEAILPLHYFRLLRARGVDAFLVVHERTRDELERLLPDETERIFYVEDMRLQRLLWRASEKLPKRVADFSLGFLMHLLTQAKQQSMVRELVRERGVEVVHEPSPVSPKLPSMMYGLGAPVIIGPLNGGMEYPPGFEKSQGRFERSFMAGARRLSHLVHRAVPGKPRAARILVANERTKGALPRGASADVAELVENGVDLDLFSTPSRAERRADAPCRFVYLGRLVDWKAVDILLDAFARASERVDIRLDLIGDGDERAALEARASDLGVDDKVTFHGFVPQARCPSMLANSDALVLTSIYECGGAVVLEAMAMGLPAIAPNWGGPVDYLDEQCGRLVDPRGGPELFRERVEAALVELAEDPALRVRLGENAARRVREHFDWQRKIDAILVHYEDVRARRADSGSPS